MARKALLKAKPAVDFAIDALFPPAGACLFCSSKLEDADFRPICSNCSKRQLNWFTYERRLPGEYWDRYDGHVSGRIGVVGQEALFITKIIAQGNTAAIAEISKAMATCVPPIRYIRTDGVYQCTEGLEASRASALKALAKQLARSLACDSLGQVGKRRSDWQEGTLEKYGGGYAGPQVAYPVLICESHSVNEAAAMLIPMGAKEIILVDADGL